jgi:hypothetical protein
VAPHIAEWIEPKNSDTLRENKPARWDRLSNAGEERSAPADGRAGEADDLQRHLIMEINTHASMERVSCEEGIS